MFKVKLFSILTALTSKVFGRRRSDSLGNGYRFSLSSPVTAIDERVWESLDVPDPPSFLSPPDADQENNGRAALPVSCGRGRAPVKR